MQIAFIGSMSLPVSRVIGISLSIYRLVHVLASVARICLRFLSRASLALFEHGLIQGYSYPIIVGTGRAFVCVFILVRGDFL